MLTEKELRKGFIKAQIKEESQIYKTLIRRIFSGIIDGAICVIPASCFILLFGNHGTGGRYVIVALLIQAVSVIYNTIAIWMYGTTIGKKYFGLVIKRNVDEGNPNIYNALLREALNMVNWLVYFGLFIFSLVQNDIALGDKIMRSQIKSALWGYISIIIMVITYSEIITSMFSTKRRAVHDFIGGTVVVKTEGNSMISVKTIIAVSASLAVWFIYLRLYGLMR